MGKLIHAQTHLADHRRGFGRQLQVQNSMIVDIFLTGQIAPPGQSVNAAADQSFGNRQRHGQLLRSIDRRIVEQKDQNIHLIG